MSASPTQRREVADRLWADPFIREIFEEAFNIGPIATCFADYIDQLDSGHVARYTTTFNQWVNQQVDEVMPC